MQIKVHLHLIIARNGSNRCLLGTLRGGILNILNDFAHSHRQNLSEISFILSRPRHRFKILLQRHYNTTFCFCQAWQSNPKQAIITGIIQKLICQSFSNINLLCAENSIPCITQTRNNILLIIQAIVRNTIININVWM